MVRDVEGQFRAFANVCRHRGSRVVSAGRGTKDRFTCPFDAWTYQNDGSLLAVNKSHQFGDVSGMDLPLIELPSAEMYGTLWVRPAPGEPIDENECLAGLQDDLAHWNLAENPHVGSQVIDARMNWKLGIDSYGKVYHLNVLHRKTVGDEVQGNLQTCDRFEKNLRMVSANQKFNLMRFLMSDQSRWPYRQVTSTVYFFYPNIIMMVESYGVDLLRIFPLDDSPSSSRTIHTWYIHPKIQQYFIDSGTSYDERFGRFRESVEQEDYVMGAEIQKNAECGIQKEIELGRNELALQHFHNAYRLGVGRALLSIEATYADVLGQNEFRLSDTTGFDFWI